ncbi:MAG TPA: hypothetical protein ENJ18_02510 [Nannocystis exedens]|nr:hypothetical protein [Nannocystis exedens]
MSVPPERSPRDHLLLIAFVFSGAAALGYELLWTRLLALTLGHETLGVYGTLAGFFAGMALGSALLHRRAAEGPSPLRLFVMLEITAAVFALLSPDLLHGLAARLPTMLGPWAGDNQSGGALVLSLLVATVLLLPGTFCLGATLPALVAAQRRAHPAEGGPRGLGRLYAANTLGATLGVLGTVYLLLPALGYRIGALALSALGLTAAALAHLWGRRLATHNKPTDSTEPTPEPTKIDTSGDPDPDLLVERWPLFALAFGGGLVGVGLEIVGLQILSQRLENTIFTFANVLAIYLLATAIGAAIYQRLAPRATAGRPATVIAGLLLALAGSVVVAAIGLGHSPALALAWIPKGANLLQAATGELMIAGVVFALPAALMGAFFSHVIGLVSDRGAGRIYALNTLGSALAPFVFGLLAMPTYGYSDSLYMVAYAYLALFLGFCWVRRFPTKWLIGGVLAVVGATALGPVSLNLIDDDEGWRIIERRETLHGVLTVSELDNASTDPAAQQAPPLRRLQVGQHFRMGGARSFGERRMGHLPLLIAKDPSEALFLGVGAGATVGAAADFDTSIVGRVEGIELVPEVLQLLPHFEAINNRLYDDPRFRLRSSDARRAIAAMPEGTALPVIVGDLFHPGRDGAGSLYTVEHFAAIHERLAPGGLFCQWLPLHQLDEASLAAIFRTFLAVFDDAHAFLGIYNAQTPALALVGVRAKPNGDSFAIDLEALATRMQTPELTIHDPRDLLASYLLGPEGLATLGGDDPSLKQNRDLRPLVVFSAPRAAYSADDALGADNLARILEIRANVDASLLRGDPKAIKNLIDATRSYRIALDHYLRGEIGRTRRGNAALGLADIAPYLAAYSADPDFPPARGLLYAAAAADPAIAAAVLPTMIEVTPNEPRVYRAYLQHLQRNGDRAAFDRVYAEARRRFDRPAPSKNSSANSASTDTSEVSTDPPPSPGGTSF